MPFDMSIVGKPTEAKALTYTWKDVVLYALGVGAPADPLDQKELQFVYELSGEGFKVLPTFAVLFPSRMIDVMLTGSLAGVSYNPMMLLHGEQYLSVNGPLPTHGTITCKPKIAGVYDKGSGALIVTDVPCYDEAGVVWRLTCPSREAMEQGLGACVS